MEVTTLELVITHIITVLIGIWLGKVIFLDKAFN
jgi:hypothetical protein